MFEAEANGSESKPNALEVVEAGAAAAEPQGSSPKPLVVTVAAGIARK